MEEINHTTTCIKIVLFGPESTGKTALAKALAEKYNTQWVPEFARDYLQKKYDEVGEICAIEDLTPIVEGQNKLENDLLKQAKKILFCDTNPLQTWVYAKVYYPNFEVSEIGKALKQKAFNCSYDLYLLTDIDVPWEEDVLRDKPHEREIMFEHFQKQLFDLNLPFHKISGNLEERINLVESIISSTFKIEKSA